MTEERGNNLRDDSLLNVNNSADDAAMASDTKDKDDELLDSNKDSSKALEPPAKIRYEYPTLRFSVVFRIILFISTVVIEALWLSGEKIYRFIRESEPVRYDPAPAAF